MGKQTENLVPCKLNKINVYEIPLCFHTYINVWITILLCCNFKNTENIHFMYFQ